MTGAALLAGVLAAAGITDLLGTWPRRRRRAPRAEASRSALVELLIGVGRRLGAPAAPSGLAERIAAAGSPLGLGVRDVMALKAGTGVTALVSLLPWASTLPGRLPWLVPIAAPVAGFIAPDLVLRQTASSRARRMEQELADVLDLVRVAVAAGLPAMRALAEVGRRHPGRLAGELRRAAGEVALGVRRDEALRRLQVRCPAQGVAELALAIARAERSGVPLADALAAQALEARAREARRIADDAARAGPKMQLVIALLLVPSVMLLVAAALLSSFTSGGPS